MNLRPTEQSVLVAIRNASDAGVRPTYRGIAEATGHGVANVHAIVGRLEEIGLVTIRRSEGHQPTIEADEGVSIAALNAMSSPALRQTAATIQRILAQREGAAA